MHAEGVHLRRGMRCWLLTLASCVLFWVYFTNVPPVMALDYGIKSTNPDIDNCVTFVQDEGYNVPNDYGWFNANNRTPDRDDAGNPAIPKGDLVWWDYGVNNRPYQFHVAIYEGNGWYLEANRGTGWLDVRNVDDFTGFISIKPTLWTNH